MSRAVPRELWGDYPAQLSYLARPLDNGCWEFTGFTLPHGYGQLGRNFLAHRLAWEVANGRPVPEGLVVDHICHNLDPNCPPNDDCPHRRCVNPAHLEAVTSGTNNHRGKGLTSINAAKTHCANGHEFTPGNTYWRPDRPGRICRTCRDAGLRRHREANRERIAAAAREYRRRKRDAAA